VAGLLRLNEFTTGRNTPTVANELCGKNVLNDVDSAQAMSRVCQEFGLVELRHIQNFVARMTDSWDVRLKTPKDVQSAGLAFARSFATCSYSYKEIADAYIEGVREGTSVLQHWERRRRTKRTTC